MILSTVKGQIMTTSFLLWIKSYRKGIKLQKNRSRNTSKKVCIDIQRRKEVLKGRSQEHSSTQKIHISFNTSFLLWIKSYRKWIKLQKNRSRNTSKKLCIDIQRRKEVLKGRSQEHSSTQKIHISKLVTVKNKQALRRRRIQKSNSFQNIFNSQVSNYLISLMLLM
jgi:site-specific recombinase XerD